MYHNREHFKDRLVKKLLNSFESAGAGKTRPRPGSTAGSDESEKARGRPVSCRTEKKRKVNTR